jgi:hypothetical protein
MPDLPCPANTFTGPKDAGARRDFGSASTRSHREGERLAPDMASASSPTDRLVVILVVILVVMAN